MKTESEIIKCPMCAHHNPLNDWFQIPFCEMCGYDTTKTPSKTWRFVKKVLRELERTIRRTADWWIRPLIVAALIRFILYGVL